MGSRPNQLAHPFACRNACPAPIYQAGGLGRRGVLPSIAERKRDARERNRREGRPPISRLSALGSSCASSAEMCRLAGCLGNPTCDAHSVPHRAAEALPT